MESDWWLRDNPGEMEKWAKSRVDGLQHYRNYLQPDRDATIERQNPFDRVEAR